MAQGISEKLDEKEIRDILDENTLCMCDFSKQYKKKQKDYT